MPLHAGIEVERLLPPRVHDLLRVGRLEHSRHHVILRPVILVTRRVREQLANRDVVRARQIRNIFADLVIQRKLPLLLQKQNRRRGKLLADRADAVTHLRCRGRLRLEPRIAIRFHVNDLSIFDNRDRGTRDSSARERVSGDLVDFFD